MKLKNKVCIVTGGATGIGKCLVETFSKEGARVYFIDKNLPANEVVNPTKNTWGYSGDIANQDTLDSFINYILAKEKQVDILINNACLTKGGIHSECSYEDFLYVQRVGVAAPFWLTQRLKKYFATGASIVNVSSTRAFQSQPDTESYSAAKGGITALTHALAISLAGIARVNAIAPGWIETAYFDTRKDTPLHSENDIKQHPSQRIGTPEDIARAVLFLCDEQNSFINAESLTIDGGMSKLMIYHNDEGWTLQHQVSKNEYNLTNRK